MGHGARKDQGCQDIIFHCKIIDSVFQTEKRFPRNHLALVFSTSLKDSDGKEIPCLKKKPQDLPGVFVKVTALVRLSLIAYQVSRPVAGVDNQQAHDGFQQVDQLAQGVKADNAQAGKGD